MTTSPAILEVFPAVSTTGTRLNTRSKSVLKTQPNIQKHHKLPAPLVVWCSPAPSFDCMKLSNTSYILFNSAAVFTFQVSPKNQGKKKIQYYTWEEF